MLLPVAYKVLSNILVQQLLPYTEQLIGPYQRGFMKGKLTVDQIFTLQQVLEKAREYKIQTHHLFIDFKNAHDSVNRKELYAALENLKIPKKLVRLCWATLEGGCCMVRQFSGEFLSTVGIRQGDRLLIWVWKGQ